MIDRKELGRRIAQIRKLKGLTQEAMAERLGLSASGVASIEIGRSDTSITRLQDIAKVLDMKLIDLLFGEFDGMGQMRRSAVPDYRNFDPIEVFTDPDLRSLQAKLLRYEQRAREHENKLMAFRDLLHFVRFFSARENVEPEQLHIKLSQASKARLPTLGLDENEARYARSLLMGLLNIYFDVSDEPESPGSSGTKDEGA